MVTQQGFQTTSWGREDRCPDCLKGYKQWLHFWRAHWTEGFTSICVQPPQKSKEVMLLPFHRQGDWGTERLSNSLQITCDPGTQDTCTAPLERSCQKGCNLQVMARCSRMFIREGREQMCLRKPSGYSAAEHLYAGLSMSYQKSQLACQANTGKCLCFLMVLTIHVPSDSGRFTGKTVFNKVLIIKTQIRKKPRIVLIRQWDKVHMTVSPYCIIRKPWIHNLLQFT